MELSYEPSTPALTLYDKLYRDHVVDEGQHGHALLYIDRCVETGVKQNE